MVTNYSVSASSAVGLLEKVDTLDKSGIVSLSEVWAKKYIRDLRLQDQALLDLEHSQSRIDIAKKLVDVLRSISARAWNKTEDLLSGEIRRHQINANLIDPWIISKDVHRVYEAALAAYAKDVTPQRFSVVASKHLGAIRQKHTAVDSRAIGFVSMQFHYCGQMLLAEAPEPEQLALQNYFKVVDDLLYMPLQRAYAAAAKYDYHHPRLETVRLALPATSRIAKSIVNQVIKLCPDYASYTGSLSHDTVRTSSIRDVEMFQIYLWTCMLENNISAIAQELFPLCVMLYPTLKVNWGLVRLMVNLLDQELSACVGSINVEYYEPHYNAMLKMFSPSIFPDSI
ncbi:hypothetical protein IQ273_29790 [Nodosilinea sp. LEGE 07298]|uniref:hypothetical protein n=1 Tax=Nodosilinea sp. LEGE 07298 TaxID=2777970 RepID=UPI001882E2D1|nr:hypothetical protein [Nodosilinea sp. LEGE 07298]MBE9113573.1 hypothetical protein [Nodosilinea sp. LEGE 07298]